MYYRVTISQGVFSNDCTAEVHKPNSFMWTSSQCVHAARLTYKVLLIIFSILWMDLVVCLPLCCVLCRMFLFVNNLYARIFFVLFANFFFCVGFSVCLQALIIYAYQSVHKQCTCLCAYLTWVCVKLAFHCLGNALQFDSLQGALSMDSGGQTAQCLPDKAGHLPHCEDLQQFTINGRKCPQKHRLSRKEQS